MPLAAFMGSVWWQFTIAANDYAHLLRALSDADFTKPRKCILVRDNLGINRVHSTRTTRQLGASYR